MPLIRCPQCGQPYDIPSAVALRLPASVAICKCGEWLSGSKAALLARLLHPGQAEEIDLDAFRVDAPDPRPVAAPAEVSDPGGEPVNVRIIARGVGESATNLFTIDRDPLWIGRRGSHVEIDDAELSIRHCSLIRRGSELVVRDEESHTGTFLDGEPISEAPVGEGLHLLRVGAALICVERTEEPGKLVEPITLDPENVLEISSDVARRLREHANRSGTGHRPVLVCVEGALKGQQFDIPDEGLTVGREGNVRVPDDYLSRRHFEVRRDADGAIRIRDLGSRNGTFLNTLPARNTKVRPGDEIQAGVNRFRIEEK